ncbi:hydroxyproline-rich glycoprotein family protein [Striga asiatica]|uniref:Hydroxyproline-rich glycoprotein family protein n=1 Tax=Striga asiatica TaxID=4170 RepID=A0A5A7QSY1_STRAF|nr:hydroxyproline-rich glycoprotein family protein [Striga asiatica]
MAFLPLSVSLSAPGPKTAMLMAPSSHSTLSSPLLPSSSETLSLLSPLNCFQISRAGNLARGRRRSWIVRMAPEEQRLTRRSPLDFPVEWEKPKHSRRPDIFPQFSPMKTPLPPPMPGDPPPDEEEEEEDEDNEEEKEKENEEEEEEEETKDPEEETPGEPLQV